MLCELYLHIAFVKNKIKVPGNDNISQHSNFISQVPPLHHHLFWIIKPSSDHMAQKIMVYSEKIRGTHAHIYSI